MFCRHLRVHKGGGHDLKLFPVNNVNEWNRLSFFVAFIVFVVIHKIRYFLGNVGDGTNIPQ